VLLFPLTRAAILLPAPVPRRRRASIPIIGFLHRIRLTQML
jgi:hypothetical protein